MDDITVTRASDPTRDLKTRYITQQHLGVKSLSYNLFDGKLYSCSCVLNNSLIKVGITGYGYRVEVIPYTSSIIYSRWRNTVTLITQYDMDWKQTDCRVLIKDEWCTGRHYVLDKSIEEELFMFKLTGEYDIPDFNAIELAPYLFERKMPLHKRIYAVLYTILQTFLGNI